MRIAILSDAVLATPTPGAHGLGFVAHQVSEGLKARGHDITLFAKVGSTFSGALITPSDTKSGSYDSERALARECMRVHREHPFQVILDNSHLHELSRLFPDLPVVNTYHDVFQNPARCPVLLSKGQRALMPPPFHNSWIIPNALDPMAFLPSLEPAHPPYVAFLGAMTELKQVLLAVEACARLGVKLILAGQPVGGALPFGASNSCEWAGTLVGHLRDNFLSGARVMLQLGYIESFGLTTLEAGLLGTPVAAWASGGNTDLVRDGVNGVYICSTGNDKVGAVAQAIERAWWLDRLTVRTYAERLTDVTAQIDGYEAALAACYRGEFW